MMTMFRESTLAGGHKVLDSLFTSYYYGLVALDVVWVN